MSAVGGVVEGGVEVEDGQADNTHKQAHKHTKTTIDLGGCISSGG